ncbi:MAG TPA: isoleucine--tRNA ligase [Alphaproteobacteria bacterium]|nr:isoleucine--tRNA ligase [Alphaproteobacteria bacterium]
MDYKSTVFLPQTSFSMKANLSQREPDFLNYWKDLDLYKKLRAKSKGKKKFILHFGPPYANGHIHIGHALNSILKDIIVKSYQMKGYDAPLVPGWDCHGLPIEWKIEEAYKEKGLDKEKVPMKEFRKECRDFAENWTAIQKEEFKRLGLIADFDNAYSTMAYETESKIAEQLSEFLLNGSLYRGLKPVMWSVVEKTALADAEVEYHDKTSDSIYVAFETKTSQHDFLQGASFVIWTTTPWTLPANRAIAYAENETYALLEDLDTQKRFVVGEALVKDFAKAVEKTFKTLKTFEGKLLKGVIASHPLKDHGYTFEVPLLPGDHVTLESGTGLVHTAPSHGLEDFALGKEYGLEVPETVLADGTYHPSVTKYAGLHIFKVNKTIIEDLKSSGNLLHNTQIRHSYPHSWRSKAPLIYRATAQWFISVDKNDLREKALNAIEEVNWFPPQGKNRIKAMVEQRPDWCISRQRAWGTPLCVFVNKLTGEALRDKAVQNRIVEAIAQEGADVWFEKDAGHFLKEDYDANDYEKVIDILDVWFDSGCTHAFTLTSHPDLSWPASLYLEGSDQHRGWFQASLLESCGTKGQAPFESVCTHGFVLDEKGFKMSKSLGNVVAPEKIISQMGADVLRLWVASVDYSDDVRIGKDVLKHQEDLYRRFRNTLRYLLGALSDFNQEELVSYEELPALEKWVLYRLQELSKAFDKALESFDVMSFYASLHTFCSSDLSAFYFDCRKDSLYCDDKDTLTRRSARTVMHYVFEYLTRWLAPVLSFTAEEAYTTRYGCDGKSIHLEEFLTPDEVWANEKVFTFVEELRKVRRVITGALEVERAAKTIGSSLQAQVVVYVNSNWKQLLKDVDLSELCITSNAQVIIAQPPAGAFTLEDEDIGVIVQLANGEKCDRCWKVLTEVETNQQEGHKLCNRCKSVVK